MNAIALIIFFIKKKKFRASISLDFYLLNILGVGFLEGEEKKKKKEAKPSHIFFLKKKINYHSTIQQNSLFECTHMLDNKKLRN